MELSLLQKPRYFVVGKDRKATELLSFNSMKFAKSDIWFLVIDSFKSFYIPSDILHSYKWRLSKYEFSSSNQEIIKYENNNWKIEEIDIYYISSSVIKYQVKISDPQGRVRNVQNSLNEKRNYGSLSEDDINLVIQAVDLFHSISKYNNFIDYDIQEENKKLKVEIERLKKEIQILNLKA